MAESNITTVSLPKPLVNKIKKRIAGTGFNSVSRYVTYVLRQVMSNIEKPAEEQREAFSKSDEKIVKDRLKALGYFE